MQEIEDEDIPDIMPMITKRVPKGTSDYQAAWIIDDENFPTSDSEMEAMDEGLDEDQLKEFDDVDMDSRSIGGVTSLAQSEVDSDDIDWDDATNVQALESLKTAEKDDQVFPDEVHKYRLYPN